MKASSVSSAGISNAMRYSQMRSQVELVKAQKEMDTGKVADTGLALGTRTAQSVTFERDLDRLNGIVDSNALVAARLSATQDALGQLADKAQALLSTLTIATSGTLHDEIIRTGGSDTLRTMTSILNTSLNGDYLFAGTNTDVRPIDDPAAAGSAASAAFDSAFLAHFTFGQNDPQAATITAAQMNDFLTNDPQLQSLFFGADWQNLSKATDEPIVSRIALNENAETSVSANNDGVRKLAMAASLIAGLISSGISQEAKDAVIKQSTVLVGQAIGAIDDTRSKTGLVQQRVTDANTRMGTQINLFKQHILDIVGVDPSEAATRVSDLMSHIQISFALTARIQQLSLLNFLTP